MDSFESSTLKKYRRLSQFLIVSALFNIAFGASALYQYFKPVKPLEWTNSKSAISEDSVAVLKNFLNLSYPELISKLGVKSEIEPGLHKRDIALAILHQSYQVDIARALNRPLLSFQHLSFTDGAKEKTLPVPRGLIDSDFELIAQFIKQEAWPLTSLGLFQKLKFGLKEGALTQTFYRSEPFSKLFDILKPQIDLIKEENLLSILLKGDCQDLEKFKDQIEKGSFSLDSFLLYYSDLGSVQAAIYLTKSPQFSLKNLNDKQALAFIDLLESVPDKQKFLAQNLMQSFRSDNFKEQIRAKGFELEEPKVIQELVVEKKVKQDPIPATLAKALSLPTKSKSAKTYVVQEGDSLWKISRKFKVDLETLKIVNNLDSENLKPGKVLTIP